MFSKHVLRRAPARVVWMALLILVLSVLMVGCNTISAANDKGELPKSDVYYANDMRLSVNGVGCFTKGVCVAKLAPTYSIRIDSPVELDQVVMSTLKRTDTPSPDSLGKKKKGYVYNYTPGRLETDYGSELRIAGYSKDKGQLTGGILFFENEKLKLQAGVSCNATPDYGANGIAVCQAMKGQRMQIWFTRAAHTSPRKIIKVPPVSTETDEDRKCQIAPTKDGKQWTITLPGRECRFLFETDEAPYQQFLLITVGAEQVPIRLED